MPTTENNIVEKTFLSYQGLTKYDQQIKAKMAADDAATLASAKSYADTAIANAAYDDSDLYARITANTNAITKLNGEGEGSVKKAVADGVASVVASAPENFDTLKEVADWIASDTTGAAKMQADIAKLNGAATVEGSVAKALADAKAYTDGKDTAMDTRMKAVEASLGEDGSVASQIETAIAALDATAEGSSIATAKGDKITVGVTEVDGKITAVSVSGNFDKSYDAIGSATTAETNAKNYADGLATNYDPAGTATTKVSELANGAVKTNTDNITGLTTRVETLEGTSYVEITDAQIDALFATTPAA